MVTKVAEAALTSGKEEEVHTVALSYGGQGNIGWQLREPTTSTGNPEGLKIARTTVYEPTTGEISETRQPSAAPDALTAANLQWEEKKKPLGTGETK